MSGLSELERWKLRALEAEERLRALTIAEADPAPATPPPSHPRTRTNLQLQDYKSGLNSRWQEVRAVAQRLNRTYASTRVSLERLAEMGEVEQAKNPLRYRLRSGEAKPLPLRSRRAGQTRPPKPRSLNRQATSGVGEHLAEWRLQHLADAEARLGLSPFTSGSPKQKLWAAELRLRFFEWVPEAEREVLIEAAEQGAGSNPTWWIEHRGILGSPEDTLDALLAPGGNEGE